ncbi:MAG: hypothetical protein KDD94_05065 [Calditrichaeota bacterium]|nr:hypothetical protein [Calditrichota bacterium]
MLLPKGKVLHENLNTSFTNFKHLISELNENSLSGYLRLNCWEYEAYLLFDTGSIAQAFEYFNEDYQFGKDVKDRIFEKCEEKDGLISVHNINLETILVIISVIDRKNIILEATSNENSLADVAKKLEKDEVTGIIELVFGKNQGRANVFVHDGSPVDCVIESSTGKMLSGVQIYDRIVDLSEKVKTSYRIFKGDLIAALEASGDFEANQ